MHQLGLARYFVKVLDRGACFDIHCSSSSWGTGVHYTSSKPERNQIGVRQVDLGAFRHRLMAGARQVPALPRAPVIEQHREEPHGELLARDVVGVPQQCPCGLLLTVRLPVITSATPLLTAPFMRLSSITPLQ